LLKFISCSVKKPKPVTSALSNIVWVFNPASICPIMGDSYITNNLCIVQELNRNLRTAYFAEGGKLNGSVDAGTANNSLSKMISH